MTARNSAAARLLARLWIHASKEPTLLAGLLYSWVTAVGFARLFGTGQGIGVNLIDLASASDFLISGLRDPIVTLLAVASGCWLYGALGTAVKRRSNGLPVFGAAVGLLLAAALLSGVYRSSATTGLLSRHGGSPCPLVVSLENGQTCAGRFGAATSDFVVVVQNDERSVVLPKGQVKAMQLDCSASARQAPPALPPKCEPSK